MDHAAAIIEAKHLSKRFNMEAGFFAQHGQFVYAVNDVSFKIMRGKTYALVGESGCGKTTTARLLIRMYQPDSGNIFYTGQNTAAPIDISSLPKKQLRQYREKVKYIFQDPARSLNPRMTVYEALTDALKYSSIHISTKEIREKAERIIEEVGLEKDSLMRRPTEFSGGQRQRISIARGLIMNPDALICDEIVSALDVSIQAQILDLLIRLRELRNLSLLFITHDLKVASYFCDTIGVMFRGTLVEEGPAKDLYKSAAHPYSKLLFAGAAHRKTASAVEIKSVLEQERGCPFVCRCPHALPRCKNECPEFKNIADGHKVRCFC